MIKQRHISRRLIQFIPIIIALACILIAGCSETKSGSKLNLDDHRFESVRDPRPTGKTLVTMANILTAQGKYAQSEGLLRKAIEEEPEFVPAYEHLSELYMHLGKTELAILILDAGLQQSPDNPRLLNNMGMCWLVRKDYDKALDAFVKSAGLMPDKAKYRSNMAVTLALMGRYEEARSLFEQVMTKEESEHNLAILRQAAENVKD